MNSINSTLLIFTEDPYKTEIEATIVDLQQNKDLFNIFLDKTIFYPEGGGQPSDLGTIEGTGGVATIKYVRSDGDIVIHQCTIKGQLNIENKVVCKLDWKYRFNNMKAQTGGHIVHDAVMQTVRDVKPLRGSHGKKSYIEYQGIIDEKVIGKIQGKVDSIIKEDRDIITELISFNELAKRCSFVPNLPKNRPLRIVTISGFEPVPCGGTHLRKTGEIEKLSITGITVSDNHSIVKYKTY